LQLESVYRSANIVTNICVFAAADRAKPIAIVIPTRQLLLQLAEANGIAEKSHDALIHDEKVKGLVLKGLQGTGRKAGLAEFEIIEGVVLTDSEWTPQNVRPFIILCFRDLRYGKREDADEMKGLLTPAQKLNRRMIVKMYQKEIDAVYGRTKSVL
jgi:long-chain acyl-CoA synthetase